ncbi:MAG TPA: hypothetical protein VGL83_00085 [Stellaceae bacterium]|jgi:hypothetical protein
MAVRIPLSLAAVLLVAAPQFAGAAVFRAADPSVGPSNPALPPPAVTQPGDPDAMSDSQTFSLVAGQILGAAAACEKINEQRISTATKQAVKIAKNSADNQADINAAQQYMLDAADSGRDAVKNGSADCDRVSASFTRLEWIEQNSQKLQSQLDDPEAPDPDDGE